MTIAETDNLDVTELVENGAGTIAKHTGKTGARAKVTNGRIRGHWVKGRTYYYYCRGKDPEIYLGTAEAILKAMKG